MHSPPHVSGPSPLPRPPTVVVTADPDSAACLRCGVCCHSTSDTYVRVSGADWARLGPAADRVAHFIGHRAYLRMHEGHCAALAVQLDPSTGTRLHVCTLYEQRPQVCRDLARGSPACQAELFRKSPPHP